MKTFLRIVNPIVAILILLLCLWAAFFNEGKFNPAGILQGGACFVAKGLFCLGQRLLSPKSAHLWRGAPESVEQRPENFHDLGASFRRAQGLLEGGSDQLPGDPGEDLHVQIAGVLGHSQE